jgi:acyl carrier protein
MMNDQELLEMFSRTLTDILGVDSLSLTLSTRRSDVPEWDSFSYVNFIAAIEMELGIRFSVADIESFENVGAIVAQAKVLKAAKD